MKIRSKSSTTRVITGETAFVVEPGETVEVPDELGEQLLNQPDRWEPVSTKKAVADGKEND